MSPEAARRPDGARCSGTPDRERLVALLREHYAAGRLDLDDLRHPVGIVLAAACAEETAVVLADLPARRCPPIRRARREFPRAARPDAQARAGLGADD